MSIGNNGLFCDFYELTMAQGFFLSDNNKNTVFEMFFRRNPFSSGYAILSGADDCIDNIVSLRFTQDDIDYLYSSKIFKDEFLDYLKNFKFTGTVSSFSDGDVCFEKEPLLQVEAPIIEAVLLETMILNYINYNTIIATKASRLRNIAGCLPLMEFGARRAPTDYSAVCATRSAMIGGFDSTSNTFAAKKYSVKAQGTMSHAWVMSFNTELEAFRVYASLYPENSVLLIDTYDTLTTGVENAIIVCKELKEKGYENAAVRIDSGDLSYLSKKVREKLDKANLENVKICVSNDIDEDVMRELLIDKAPIDMYGIGTKLVSVNETLGGVYKLVAIQNEDKRYTNVLKKSNTIQKATLPGKHNVWRISSLSSSPICDLITMSDEKIDTSKKYTLNHILFENDKKILEPGFSKRQMLNTKIKNGKKVSSSRTVNEIKEYSKNELMTFHETYRRTVNPHLYKISITDKLKNERVKLLSSI